MHKYERQCWSCGSRDMVDGGSFAQCGKCGATWNELPLGGSSPITIVDEETGGAPRSGKLTRARPSSTVQRRSARARGDPTASPAPK